MRSPQTLLTIALALTPLASAWSPWPATQTNSLVVRQDDAPTSQPSKTAKPESTPSTDSPKETGTNSPKPTATGKGDQDGDTSADASGTETGTGTGKDTGTATGTTTKGSTKTTKTSQPKHTTFNPQDPPGGVSMIYPPVTAPFTLYRIDDTEPITWKWNYTSLQGKPTAVDVLVSCSRVTGTWTLTQNMTYAPTATFTWDVNKYNSKQVGSQLPVEKYTLLIHDSDGSPTDVAEPGYLAPFNGFQFGLYTARPYEPLNEWNCATCSAAAGGHLDRQALNFALGMTLLTVLSFTWYVTGVAAII